MVTNQDLEQNRDFIVIDDDMINNMICKRIIELCIPGSKTYTFTNPVMGLDHLTNHLKSALNQETVLLLDINMPSMSGWDVLDKISDLPEHLRSNLKTYMLSSSVDIYDKMKAAENPLVSGYIEKPLSKDKIKDLFQIKLQ